MAEKKAKRTQYTTPRGVFVFPKLAEADTKFKKEGEYSVKLRLDATNGAKLTAMLADAHAAAIEEGRKEYAALPVKTRKKLEEKGGFTENALSTPVYDEETEQPTGEVEFNFKATASGVSKKTGKPWSRGPINAFDAFGRPFKAVDKVWSGTEGKVAFTINPYFIPGTGAAGLKLALEAVQVIQLAGPGQRSASGYGFGVEEDGFDASDYAADNAPAKADADSDDDDEDEAGADF